MFGNVKFSDLDFADDAVIFVETLDILLGALKVLNEESEPLGLWVSCVKTKIQAFNDILDAAVLSVPVCGEDVEVMERLTSFGSDIHVSAGCEQEVSSRLCRASGVMDSPVQDDESPSLQVLGASSFALWMWDLDSD